MSRAVTRPAAPPGVIAQRYHISARIGAGGMGEVFRGRDENLQRAVAIKILPADLAARPGFIERFRAEAQATARLSHPNAVHVYDWGSSDGSYYMVMEYVRGRNLREVLATSGHLHPDQAAGVILQVLAALEAAHACGLVHRDIKPENILVTPAGEVKVTDFGIASVAEASAGSNEIVGTATYAAPEQIRGESVDARADLYSAGCVLYELLCGAPPFEGNVAFVLNEHLTSPVPAPSLAEPAAELLDDVVAASTALDPADRYPSAAAMRAELEQVLRRLPASAPLSQLASEVTSLSGVEVHETLVAPAARRRRRRWPFVVAGLLVLIVLAALLFVRVVPKVTGMTQVAAQARLQHAGLTSGARQAFSDVPAGTVLSARSPIGVFGLPFALKGARVALTVSKGPDLRQEPDVTGMAQADAEQALRAIGLVPVELPAAYSADPRYPAGKVMQQAPPPGAQRPGTPVNLTVSKGPQLVAVKAVTGTDVSSATAALQGLGLVVARQSAFSDAVSGTVVDQNPKPPASVVVGATVTLVVSKGPQPVAMPNVVGQTCAAARSALQAMGLVVAVTSQSNTCAANKVLLQDPLDGLPVAKGATATLYVP